MKKVSIIVPIYNEEDNLSRCINSLINQTYKKLEIILLNDGSTDKTKEIMDSYNDKRIICIHKPNTGIGHTRNLGIDKATGDYIMFIDSDDYIEKNCVEIMLEIAEKNNCDMVISNYYLDTPTKTHEIKFENLGISSLNETPNLLSQINLGPCNKIYSSRLFKNTDNRFPTNLKYEDAPVVVQAVCDSKKIGFNDSCLFHYVIKQTGETITRDKRIFDVIKICKIIDKKTKKLDRIYKTNLFVKILSYYLKNSRYILDKKIRNQFIDEVYTFLKFVDKKWYNCDYLNNQGFVKKIIIKNKMLLKLVSTFKK